MLPGMSEPIEVHFRFDGRELAKAITDEVIRKAARGPSSLVGGSLPPSSSRPITRDEAHEGVGKLRVKSRGLLGRLQAYEFATDKCRIELDVDGELTISRSKVTKA